MAKLAYGPKMVSLDQLKVGEAGGVVLEGAGDFDRANATGRLALNSSAASLAQITGLIAPLAPALATRLNAIGPAAGPAHLKLTLNIDKTDRADRASARAVLDLDAPQLKGVAAITATPEIAALRGIDLDALRRERIRYRIETVVGTAAGHCWRCSGSIARSRRGEGPAQFEGSVTGTWRAPLRLKAKLSGTGLDVEAQGTIEPWSQEPKANVNLSMRSVSLAPLLDLKSTDKFAQSISLSSRVTLLGNKLTFDDLDSAISGSRLRGRVALTLGDERNVEGEVGLESLDLAPAFALAIGVAGHDPAEPLGPGLLKGWRGRIAFQALRGVLPDGIELRPVSGTVKSDGQSLTFDALKGGVGGGEATATIDARQGAGGIALNARVQLSGVDGAALRYRSLAMPAGRMSMQMTLASQGRSASALTGALSGSGTVILESVRIAGLDPRAFDAAIRASDNGQATDDIRLRQIVEPALSAGALPVKPAEIPFTIRDGRLRVGATTLEADGARAIISGGYDIPADQADIRAILASTAAASGSSRPEIQVFAVGSPDALNRTVDVAALSSWLAVRAIDRETRRLDSIERGEPPPPMPASIPSPAAQPKAKTGVPRPSAAPAGSNEPVVGQQAAPLPPPIEVRPAPGAVVRPPKPKPPLVLTPPVATPPRPAF